jgi:acetylglutamate kinase
VAVSARRLVVLKLGGDLVRAPGIAHLAADITALGRRGDRVVVVHGGGPQATELQRSLGQEPVVVAGRRITDEAALDVMKMAVAGKVNVDLCAALLAAGANPVGLHGASSRAIAATLRPPRVVSGGGPEPIDFGRVGDVTGFNDDLLGVLLDAGYIPVLACLGADDAGNVLNINADIVANHAAEKLGAHHLVIVTGAPGVLRDLDDPSSRIAALGAAEARAAIADGTVAGGMIPKIDESLRLLETGRVDRVHIVGDLREGDLLRALDEPGAVGTALSR